MGISELNDENLYLFHQGTNFRSYQMLGAHVTNLGGASGVRFAVWAPNAREVRVVGSFNNWSGQDHVMEKAGQSAVWVLFVPGIGSGVVYKFAICTQWGEWFMKADPYAFYAELRPRTASIIYDLNIYTWGDDEWQQQKTAKSIYKEPVLIYEVHLGSWRRNAGGKLMSYRDMADELVNYVADMGYTHMELLPVVEHPFDGSWGYQATGYYAITSRYGAPQDFMYFIDRCHQRGIGIILDWVPGHFCKDDHGLRCFDGMPLFEPNCPQRSENREWGTANFDFGRTEVQSFLISNAVFWCDVYHIDGLRVDAVANIIYLDYGKQYGEWSPNQYGGNGNLEGVAFLRKLNEAVFKYYPEVMMIAEESTAWPRVSWPTDVGGLGFNFKWNMGWMNDMLKYMSLNPLHRKWYHKLVTFSLMYAFSENFILPLSHDEVVHGKHSLLDKIPGDYWQKFAGLRAFLGYWMAHPGKKLLFMGGEFGHFIEWKYDDSLDWHLLEYPMHKKLHDYVHDLNWFYRHEPLFWEADFSWQGFEWIDCSDYSQSIICFVRKEDNSAEFIAVVCNFTPEVRENYRIGVPIPGVYREIFNSDWGLYGGSGQLNAGDLVTESLECHNRPCSLVLRIPPLATIYLKLQQDKFLN